MIRSLKILAYVLLAILILISILWFKPQPDFPHHDARDLPWTLPDYTAAKTQMNILEDGRIHIQIEHLPLKNIEPKMVSYFYKVLPISTVTLNGQTMPLYHIFHPTEHGYIWVKENAADGKLGMTEGAVVARKEWFGQFNSKGAGRILEMNDDIMVARPEMFGLHFGLITHTFEATKNNDSIGTHYTLDSKIGSTLPIIGPIINYYIRHKMFKPAMLEQWLRHQVQEVSSLQFFAKELYEQQPDDFHFVLDISKK